MKNRFCRKGIHLLYAVCLLSAVGLMNSCKDDYDLDETMPDYLKASIYDELKANGNFKTTIKLIDDLNYSEVLSKTGSKTLFVANDEAYGRFFENNPWGVRSYEQLTTAQKRYLLYNAMLDNAYVMEMMANIQSTGSFGTSGFVNGANLCLRQPTAAAPTDSVPYFLKDQLPVNYNQPDPTPGGDAGDQQYGFGHKMWDRFQNEANPRTGIYLVCDNTTPMMSHFLETNLKYNKITNDDVAFILGVPSYGTENRSYIYDARVVEQDVTCMNGYYHVLDRVLFAPSNMAEVIRTNGETSIFSHILDRFSAPVYDPTLTNNAQTLYASIQDSVFVKRYFSVNNQNNATYRVDPVTENDMDNFPVLSYDPAWNGYGRSSAIGAQRDMAAMFVPSDAAIRKFFLDEKGGGKHIMDRYATEKPVTEANFLRNLDQIPLDIISAMVNNLMKSSFNETVPSKYKTIMNDARDQMFSERTYADEAKYKSVIEKCLLANNGVIYMLNTLVPPADFSAVIGPVLYGKETRVMRTVARADEAYINGSQYNNAPLKQYFSTYLKAMQSKFSFFVPTDEGLEQHGYVDPASMGGKANYYTFWSWAYKPFTTDVAGAKNIRRLAVDAVGYRYDKTKDNDISTSSKRAGYAHSQNSTLNATDSEGKKTYGPIKEKLLIEMVNQHIIIHDNDDAQGLIGSNQRYFLSRYGAPVFVSKQGDAVGTGMEVKGGWQLQLDKEEQAGTAVSHQCVVEKGYDQTGGAEGYGNGRTYLLNRPMQATTLSTYGALAQNADVSDFMRLCSEYDQSVLDSAGFREINEAEVHQLKPAYDYTDDDWANASTLYRVFVTGEVGKSSYFNPDNLVRFFNNYRYTVYAPTNEAMQKAFENGLMKWSEIKAYINDHLEFVEGSATAKYLPAAEKEKVRKMVTLLVNFLKYHFQDESLFVDNVNNSGNYQTACVDNERNIYVPIKVEQTNGRIKVTDQNGDTQSVSTEDGKYNVLARDAHFSRNPKSATYNQDMYITTSSYAVVHQIDKVLNFMSLKSLPNQRYDDLWNTTNSTTKKFVKKYLIKK